MTAALPVPGTKAGGGARILALTRYAGLGASSRVRMHQYVPGLRDLGIEISVQSLLSDDYVRRLYAGRRRDPVDIARSFWRRLRQLRRVRDYDTVWAEKEMFPWLPAWLEVAFCPKGPRLVVDFDDAVHQHYQRHRQALVRRLLGGKIGRLIRRADVITAGNLFLADYARSQGARSVVHLPSVVDLRRYQVAPASGGNGIRIGWIGSPATEHYLQGIAGCLDMLLRKFPVTLLTVGASGFDLPGLDVQRRSWSLESEVRDIQDMDIGIMPLADSPWERGKCGYKLIQYMACGKPVVASAVGANCEIIRHGHNGFLAATADEWISCLTRLIEDRSLRERLGTAARRKVEEQYSVQSRIQQLASVLRPGTPG